MQNLKDIGYVRMFSCIPRAVGHSDDYLSLFLCNLPQLLLYVRGSGHI